MAITKGKILREERVVVGPKIAKGVRKPSSILGRNKVAVPKRPPREGDKGLPEHFFNLHYNGVVGNDIELGEVVEKSEERYWLS
jgi:hypothetical protein